MSQAAASCDTPARRRRRRPGRRGCSPAIRGTPRRTGLAEHLRRYGDPPLGSRSPPRRLTDIVERSGLTGRGGAGFPTARKLEAVAAPARRPVVVVNGMEGEPASAKDGYLLAVAPHLVLDGAALPPARWAPTRCWWRSAATAPTRCSHWHAPSPSAAAHGIEPVEPSVHAGPAALRRRRGDGARALAQRRPDPAAIGAPASVRARRGGRPTLVLNAETAAHLALIARYGDDWFRSVGTARRARNRTADGRRRRRTRPASPRSPSARRWRRVVEALQARRASRRWCWPAGTSAAGSRGRRCRPARSSRPRTCARPAPGSGRAS